jgi:hypothetical protein
MTLRGKDLFADEGCWLYQEGEDREFCKSVTLAHESSISEWNECTNEEKEQWEEEHRPPEPEQEPEAEPIEKEESGTTEETVVEAE